MGERGAQGFIPWRSSAQQGFTLIEVMVALAVFALAVLALVRLESATLRGAATIDETLAAAMVARSVAAEALTDARAPARGTAAGSMADGGRDWRWTRTVAPTADSRVLRIDVAVADARGVERGRATLVRSTIGGGAMRTAMLRCRHPSESWGLRGERASEAAKDPGFRWGDDGGVGERGFTLVEVMIALAIFAMIAVAGVAILSFGVRAGAATAIRLDGSAAVGRTMSLLAADLAQAVDRPSRDEAGVTRPAFTGESGAASSPMLSLVRGGWSNLDGAPRAGVQKVAWRVAGGALERIAWPAVDGAAPLAPATMMTGVVDVRLRYRIAGAWSDRWDGRAVALPQAVEVTIVRRDGTRWHELFLVGGGTAPVAATPTPAPTARAG